MIKKLSIALLVISVGLCSPVHSIQFLGGGGTGSSSGFTNPYPDPATFNSTLGVVGTANLTTADITQLLKNRPVINITDPKYGGKGDGVQENGAALELAMADIAAGPIKTLYVPMDAYGGQYLISSHNTFTGIDGFTMIMDPSTNFVHEVVPTESAATWEKQVMRMASSNHLRFYGVNLDGKWEKTTDLDGVQFGHHFFGIDDCDDVLFQGGYIQRYGEPIGVVSHISDPSDPLVDTVNNTTVRLIGVTFKDVANAFTTTRVGMVDVTVENCTFIRTGFKVTSRIAGAGHCSIINNHFPECLVPSTGYVLMVQGMDVAEVRGNTIENVFDLDYYQGRTSTAHDKYGIAIYIGDEWNWLETIPQNKISKLIFEGNIVSTAHVGLEIACSANIGNAQIEIANNLFSYCNSYALYRGGKTNNSIPAFSLLNNSFYKNSTDIFLGGGSSWDNLGGDIIIDGLISNGSGTMLETQYQKYFKNIELKNISAVDITKNIINLSSPLWVENFTIDGLVGNVLGVSNNNTLLRLLGTTGTLVCTTNGMYLNNIDLTGGSGGQFLVQNFSKPIIKDFRGRKSIGEESLEVNNCYDPIIDGPVFTNCYTALRLHDCTPNAYIYNAKGYGNRKMFDFDATITSNYFVYNSNATGNTTADTQETPARIFANNTQLYQLDSIKSVPYEWKYVTVNAAGAVSAKHIDAYGNLIDAQATVTDNMPAQYICLDAGTGMKRCVALSSGAELDHGLTTIKTIGEPIFVSGNGTLTQDEPLTASQRQIVGYVYNKTKFVTVSQPYTKVP